MAKEVKQKPPVADPAFVGKKMGANFIVNLGEKRYAKRVTGEEYEKIVKKMTLYNKKPTEELKATIIKMMTPEASKKAAATEKKEVAVKALTKVVKKNEKKTKTAAATKNKDLLDELSEVATKDDVPKLKAILARFKVVEEVKPAPVQQPVRRSGEH